MEKYADTFRAAVEDYLQASRLTPAAFGKATVNSTTFVTMLRGGLRPRIDTVDRVRGFMHDNPPATMRPDNG